jgi:hypothetical protein
MQLASYSHFYLAWFIYDFSDWVFCRLKGINNCYCFSESNQGFIGHVFGVVENVAAIDMMSFTFFVSLLF